MVIARAKVGLISEFENGQVAACFSLKNYKRKYFSRDKYLTPQILHKSVHYDCGQYFLRVSSCFVQSNTHITAFAPLSQTLPNSKSMCIANIGGPLLWVNMTLA
jgi:hypothetical protein